MGNIPTKDDIICKNLCDGCEHEKISKVCNTCFNASKWGVIVKRITTQGLIKI